MSIFKLILSPFVEFNEPDKSAQPKPANSTAIPPVANPASQTAAFPVPAQTTHSNNTNDFNDYFENLIEEANQKNPIFEGNDLKEYLDIKVELDTIADEAAKIKTAFNVLKKTGLTKDKLLTTGREYVKLIERDLAGIEGAFAQQYKNEVELKEQQIQAKAKEAQDLNERINTINKEINQLTQQISQSKDQLTNNKNQFILAGENKKNEIEAELKKINQYL